MIMTTARPRTGYSICEAEVDTTKPVLSSWLFKKPLQKQSKGRAFSKAKAWKRRWVALHPRQLISWRDGPGKRLLGEMSLQGCVVELRTAVEGEAVVVINHPLGDTLALTGEHLSEWKDALERVIIGAPSAIGQEDGGVVIEVAQAGETAAAQAGETRCRKQSYDMDRAEVCLRSLRGCYDSDASPCQRSVYVAQSVSSSDPRWQLRQSVEEKTNTDMEARLALEEMGFSTVQVDKALLLTVQGFQQGLEFLLNAATSQGQSQIEPSQPSGGARDHVAKQLHEPRGLAEAEPEPSSAEASSSSEPNLAPCTLEGNAAVLQGPTAAHPKMHRGSATVRPGAHAPIPSGMPPTWQGQA